MKSPNLNREQLNDLKELLTERMVDNMTVKDLESYVADDLFNYFDKLGEHEFLDEAKNYWDDHFPDIVQELIEDTTPWQHQQNFHATRTKPTYAKTWRI